MGITATALAWQSPLRIALVLAAVMIAPPLEVAAQKLPPEGERLDPTFGHGGRVLTPFAEATANVNALALQADGKLVVTGLEVKGSSWNVLLLRYRPDGSLDPAFGAGGVVVTDIAVGSMDDAKTVAVQADGKIVVGGSVNRSGEFGGDSDFLIARYREDGSLDSSFGHGDGIVTLDLGYIQEDVSSLALQPDGKIVAAGGVGAGEEAEADFVLLRFRPDGSLDPTFGNGGIVFTDFTQPGGRIRRDNATALRLQPDGTIVVAGNSYELVTRISRFAFARYMADGSPDPTFGAGGKLLHRFTSAFVYLHAIALQPDGKILASGVRVWNWESSWIITRYESHGAPDAGFGSASVVELPYKGRAAAIAVQEDKGIFVAGNASLRPRATAADFGLARLTPTGAVDPEFGVVNAPVLTDFAGSFDTPAAIAIQPDGRVVVAGVGQFDIGQSGPALARYIVGTPTP